jgi:5-methylthioadenosine/S-adenosylhomocysteine deaminase
MNTLIRDVKIIPMNESEFAFSGDIGITAGKISFIGPRPQDFTFDTVIEGSGMVAMPGLVNAHTHLSMVYFRNYKDSVENLHDWLSEIWPLEDLLTTEDILPASRLGIAEMIRSGTTCFADMYLFPETTCQAVLESGIKANIGLTLFGGLVDSKRRMQSRLPLVDPIMARSEGRILLDVAPHAIYTCPQDTLEFARDFAKERACRIHTHISETLKEVQDCIFEHRVSPISYLHRLGLLTPETYLAHCVHPVSDDLKLLAQSEACVVHNPSSNCKLASGIAPLASMRDSQVRLALGTDGASSNNSLDLFHDVRLASMLSAVSTGNPIAITPFEILRMATIGGASALGRQLECGTIEIGKDADIILIDTRKPHLTPCNNIFSALVYSAKSTDVDTVLCQGKVLMRDGKLTTIDTKEASETTNRHWAGILSRANQTASQGR